ncbi:MAG: hypothetical protein AB7P40_26010 [Chloroflexota bacterium]
MSEHHEEESLRRWAREQAEIERQTDALVLRTLTAMVTAAEDLKTKLRRDTEAILEEFRKTKRGLENEISLSTAERQRFRREVEQERESILAEATSQAREIVQTAEREREQLLHETRAMEQRLRGIEGQIRAVFVREAAEDAASEAPDEAEPAPAQPPIRTLGSSSSSAPAATPFTPAITPRPVQTVPAATPPDLSASFADSDLADDEEEEQVQDESVTATLPATAPTDQPPEPAPAFTPAPPPPTITMPAAEPTSASSSASRPAAANRVRTVELVFDGVPGYQQASALERAVDDLAPDGDVDIVDFEDGQLVLNVQVSNLEALADQLIAAAPTALELEGVDGDRAMFHCL